MRQADSLQALSDIVAPLFAELGVPSFALARFFRSDRSVDVAVLTGRFNKDWSSRYVANGYAAQSQIAREMLVRSSPYSWEQVMRDRPVSSRQMRIREEAKEFGLGDGIFFPARWADGSYVAVVLAGFQPPLEDPLVRTTVEVLAAYYALEVQRLYGTKKRERLSSRQQECLKWARQGKSSGMIADILGISEATVHEHISKACKKLGVRTRVQAVVEATVLGLLDDLEAGEEEPVRT
jgi:DNA-binding CsgD family transcriptional regulator